MTREWGFKYLWYLIVASPLYDEIIDLRKQLEEAEDTIKNQQKTIDKFKAQEDTFVLAPNVRGKRFTSIIMPGWYKPSNTDEENGKALTKYVFEELLPSKRIDND
jgi:hypothetical protein